MASVAAAVVLVLLIGAFGFQEWQLSHYQSQWTAMAPKVTQLETLNNQIHRFRPWYDDSMRALAILKRLSATFPEDGTVSAKTIEIRDLNSVTCTGTTKDRTGVIKVFEELRGLPEISEAGKVTIRGNKTPLQFTFDFRWGQGGANE